MKKIIKKILGAERSARLRKKSKILKTPKTLLKVAFGNTQNLSLTELGQFYGTDKVDEAHSFKGMNYMNIYEKYFETIRNKEISFLEIGVKEGYSLRTWDKYFKNGRIKGLDIDPRCSDFATKDIEIAIGSQIDVDFLKKSFNDCSEFDVILDDGAHVNHMIIKSFEYLFYNRLKSGGLYIIEDLGCSYSKLQTDNNVKETWPGMKYNGEENLDNTREEMDLFFNKIIHQLDHLRGEVLSIHFYSRICVIIKA